MIFIISYTRGDGDCITFNLRDADEKYAGAFVSGMMVADHKITRLICSKFFGSVVAPYRQLVRRDDGISFDIRELQN